MMKIDYHVHTSYSDGTLTYDQLFLLAKSRKIETISITDHETIVNLKDFHDYEKKYQIQILPGIEIPTDHVGMHLLGYNIKNFSLIENSMYSLKKYNEEQNRQTIEVLSKNGVYIDFESVKMNSNVNIVTYRDIVKYLLDHGYVNNALDAYTKYIGKGTAGYFPSKRLSPQQVINLINVSGGISILAHPFTLERETNFDYLLPMLKEMGLSGIESISPKIVNEVQEYYISLAQKYNLINTAGSDFHNAETDNLGVEIEEKYVEKFREKILLKNSLIV